MLTDISGFPKFQGKSLCLIANGAVEPRTAFASPVPVLLSVAENRVLELKIRIDLFRPVELASAMPQANRLLDLRVMATQPIVLRRL